MNMETIREKSKPFLWICLIGFVLSLVGVMGTGGGGFLGGASLTSLFSDSVNPASYVGKIGDRNISRNFFAREVAKQRNNSQFQINATESYYIGRAWDAIISNTIIINQVEKLNLETQNLELKDFLMNSPPTSLKNFLVQNKLFLDANETFDLELYKFTINNNIQWIPDSLANVFTNYESQLKRDDLPRAKLQNLYDKLTSLSYNQIKSEFEKTNLNCNIDVLIADFQQLPDEDFIISDDEIENYYQLNKNEKFTTLESIGIDYVLFNNIENADDSLEVILNEDQRLKAIDFALDAQPDIMGFNQALETWELSISDTINITQGFKNNSGLPINMGYNRNIIRFAFDNPIGSVSDRIITQSGIAIFRIIKSNKSGFKELKDVSNEIKSTLLLEKKEKTVINLFNNLTNSSSKWEKSGDIYNYITYSSNEESTIGGSFKSFGKDYKVMGCLASMDENEISQIISSNNKLILIKLNNIDTFNKDIFDENFNSIRERLLVSTSNNLFYNWIQYVSDNIKKIDVRHKSI